MSKNNTNVQGLRSNVRPIRTHEINEHMKLLSEQKRCIEKDASSLRSEFFFSFFFSFHLEILLNNHIMNEYYVLD